MCIIVQLKLLSNTQLSYTIVLDIVINGVVQAQ